MKINYILVRLLIISTIFFSYKAISKDFSITGNEFSDEEVIISLIGELPELDDKSKSNYILKELNKSGLFKSVDITFDDNYFYINVIEYPTINKIFYQNNKRIKDEQIDQLVSDLEIFTLSDYNINSLINELTKIYQSFGYNNIQIDTEIESTINSSANLYLNFKEGKITKIKNIYFIGNTSYDNNFLASKIKSKTKKITKIFSNNNFKLFQVNDDILRLLKFYKSEGYIDVNSDFEIEYYDNNKVDITFKINEGERYYFDSVDLRNKLNDSETLKERLDLFLKETNLNSKPYDRNKLDELEFKIANILELSGEQFFEIKIYDKLEKNKAKVLLEILPAKPIYINQINISGNTRTYEYVLRRELDIAEGDPVNDTRIKQITKKLKQLYIFENVDVSESSNMQGSTDININVKETQTGSFNVGLSVGTLEGVSFVSGLKEKNINGTGRSLEFLINTSEDNKAFTLSTTEKFFLNNDINHKYATIYKENDYTKSKSYKLNTLSFDTDLSYELSDDFYHTFGVGYQLKDYIITNSSTVSDSIAKSSGESISFNINNEFVLNTLNSFIRPTKGDFLKLSNYLQTPSSSSNGYIKNILTAKKYIENKRNIYSIQARLGNIYSLNDSEILSDDKFSLGGRWLRGFDNFGAGPRDSRTAYVGGNNLAVTKLDFSRPINLNDQNPIYFNLFNDYGMVWDNKNTTTFSDESIRASYGFGINYYSPIGPIGFSWGFPLSDKDYDIKRMFSFTIGNLN